MHSIENESRRIITRSIIHLIKNKKSAKEGYINVANLIKEKTANREYFYGIEISNNMRNELNYNSFKKPPLFTSITWIGDENVDADPIKKAPAIKLGHEVEQSSYVIQHLSCYKLTDQKLDQFLLENVGNVLAVRGDYFDEIQPFKHGSDLVKELRRKVEDNLCIFVGGYPECHPESKSRGEDLLYLKEKVHAGADAIITQLCFSESNLISFIQDCRENGINVPIVPGIYVPKSYEQLTALCKITKVTVPTDILEEYEKYKDDNTKFEEVAISHATQLIRNLFNSNLNIFGVHFFTLGWFDNIQKIIENIFDNKSK